MTTTRIAAAAAAMLLMTLGCSSAGGPGPDAAPTVTSENKPRNFQTPTGSFNLTTSEERDVINATILAPADSVWPVLGSVFLELGVEPGTINNQEHYIANTAFKVQRKLGGVSLNRYLDCGSSATGPVALQAQITMSLSVQVVADSANVSRLRSQVSGHAVPEGVATASTNCATTGQLEARVARMVTDAIAHRAKK